MSRINSGNDPKSLLMLISSMFIYGTVGVLRRYTEISSGLLSLIRGITGSAFLLVIIIISRRKVIPKADSKTYLMLVFSGAAVGFNWILLFESYNHTTVATATLCYYLEPSIVMLVSPLFFKEKLTGKKLACIAVSFVGMVFVSGVIQNGLPCINEIKGILFGIGAAILYSAVVIMNKKLSSIEPLSKTFVQLISAVVVLTPYVLITQDIRAVPTDPRSLTLILIMGLVHTGLAYTLYFASINKLKTQTVAIFSYVDPVTALLASFFILGEKMSVLGAIGAVMMICSAVVSVTGKGDEAS